MTDEDYEAQFMIRPIRGKPADRLGALATIVWLELTKEQTSHCTIADVKDILTALEKAQRRIPARRTA